MDIVLVALITIAIGILAVLFFLNKKKEDKIEEEPATNAPVRNLNRPRANADHPARNRLRNRIQTRNVAPQDNEDDQVVVGTNFEYDENGELIVTDDVQDREELRKKVGTKKLAKIEEKAEKRRRNEEMLKEREERKAKEEEEYENRKKQEEEEERLEKEREEEERLAKEEQERIEHEEYLKLKEAFSIEEEGQEQAQTEEESQNLLIEFVEFIKKNKVVVLEDLAAEFKLKTQDIIDRVNLVQEIGMITGVMDDRGKFIYISEEELNKVKRFIEVRGRVNISELAKSSNELINLSPVADNVEATA